MDFLNKVTEGGDKKDGKKESGGGGLMDQVNNFAGGGKQGEKNEDALDKGECCFPHPVPKSTSQDPHPKD